MLTTSQRIAAWRGTPVPGQYAIAFEASIDEPVSVLIPDPSWLAMALAGGILPPLDSYAGGLEAVDAAAPLGPMTEEQAMEYLLQKDVPRHVWDAPAGNRRRFAITRKDMLPTSRQWRGAWKLKDLSND